MRKWRTALAAISFAIALAGSFTAYGLTGSAQGNAGDVWVGNVGQLSGPGHEEDPHLMCADINLCGNGLADASGTFIIDSWSPTGNGAPAYRPATLAGTGGGPGNVAGSGGTMLPLAMILILVGGLLIARDAFRR